MPLCPFSLATKKLKVLSVAAGPHCCRDFLTQSACAYSVSRHKVPVPSEGFGWNCEGHLTISVDRNRKLCPRFEKLI